MAWKKEEIAIFSDEPFQERFVSNYARKPLRKPEAKGE